MANSNDRQLVTAIDYSLSAIRNLLFAISAGSLFSGEPLQYEQDYNRSDDRQDQAGGMKR
jgi:hypothetical protein